MKEPQPDLEGLTRSYAAAHDVLAQRMDRLEAEVGKVKRRYLRGIKSAAEAAAARKQALFDYVRDHLDEFERPKTRTLHGVKVGLVKGRKKLVCENKEFTIAAIKQRHPGLVGVLLKTTTRLLISGLKKLDAEQLVALGVVILDPGDRVVVRHVDGEVEKLVDTYLADDALRQDAA